jgi:hypothetical protein
MASLTLTGIPQGKGWVRRRDQQVKPQVHGCLAPLTYWEPLLVSVLPQRRVSDPGLGGPGAQLAQPPQAQSNDVNSLRLSAGWD